MIETAKSKGGSLVSVVVKNGTLKKGLDIYANGISCRVKGLFGETGNSLDKVTPGEAAQILGFSELPIVGSIVKDAAKNDGIKEKDTRRRNIKKIDEDEAPVVIKAGSTGSLDAVLENIPEKIVVIDSGVGDVNESDVVMAKSADAIVFAFEAKVRSVVSRLAKTEGVTIEELVEGKREKVVASAKIIAEFPYNTKKVAGCSILEGEIVKGDKVALVRNDEEIGKVRVTSIRKVKQEVSKAVQGDECGIIFAPQLDFVIGDMLLSVRK